MPKRRARLPENSADRRARNRLDIKQDVRYKVFGDKNSVKDVGTGKTIDMSSGGLLITTDSTLTEGDRVEIAVNWPAQLNGVLPLKLVVTGRVVRSCESQAAVALDKHVFKTRGTGAF